METFYSLPFQIFEIPNLKLNKPSWVRKPSAMFIFSLVLVSYFLITSGIIYNVINEPPSIGSTTDEQGHQKPVAFMTYRVNGQYIMEGLASSFMFSLGGVGFIILDQVNKPLMPRLYRILLLCVGFASVLVSFFMCRMFMKIKMPSYLMN